MAWWRFTILFSGEVGGVAGQRLADFTPEKAVKPGEAVEGSFRLRLELRRDKGGCEKELFWQNHRFSGRAFVSMCSAMIYKKRIAKNEWKRAEKGGNGRGGGGVERRSVAGRFPFPLPAGCRRNWIWETETEGGETTGPVTTGKKG